MTDASDLPLICLTVCTRGRPALLRRALGSVAALEPPVRHRTCLVVVENEPDPTLADEIAAMDPGMEVHYRHEDRIGIVHARNRALETAEALGATWVASFDDDEELLPDWLRAYEDAMEAHPDARMLSGPYWFRYPDGYPAVLERDGPTRADAEAKRPLPAPGNVLIHRDVFGQAGAHIRFHPWFNLTGGEGQTYFEQAKAAGFPMRWVPQAIIREDRDGERARFGHSLYRSMTRQVSVCRRRRLTMARGAAVFVDVHRFFYHLIRGTLYFLAVLPMMVTDRAAALHRIGRGARDYAKVAGIMIYTFGGNPRYYGTIGNLQL